ncbi:polyhydroxyalkanoate synthesis repressor PhaR [Halovulum dunhuangense]|uniref:Polyhydroxyalkanoate synthesis repressor PhaR n=1 Tax=Halovulum dunhuangense TaxID=1505036 RepID=A0A849KRZ0_9RHOB|nr:polyhydroxyalkanoate synthesis repressor PhaR [Halovulum dunhuangense]NNU79639.1 polyhydroxyalkanoate synthesis repressor PhaR [Halovulum dunhuangense]
MARTQNDAGEPIVIKKYANRRLYNTEKSAYVTLEDLALMVREGTDFVVRDAKSGEDITRAVLTQIIFEEEAKGQTMLPANFLRQLIRLYGDTLQGVVPGYLEASMETFLRNQEKLREHVAQAFGTNPAMANFEALTRTNMEIYENAMRMFSPFGQHAQRPSQKPTTQPEPAPARKDVELDELKDQLRAMQEQLSRLVKDT